MTIKPKNENTMVEMIENSPKKRGRPKKSEKINNSTQQEEKTVKTRKKRIAKPTKKQKEVIKILEEKDNYRGGKMSKKKILATAGYGPSSQKTPNKVFLSESMQRLFEESGFSVETLKKVHIPLFSASSVFYVQIKSDQDPDEVRDAYLRAMPELEYITTTTDSWGNPSIAFKKPDNLTILRALEIGYKILGAFAPEKIAITDKDGNDAPISSVAINIIHTNNDQDPEHQSE